MGRLLPLAGCAGFVCRLLFKLVASKITVTLLVIEDEPPLLAAISKALRRQGYGVLTADGPHQAVAICQTHPAIDVVLSDIMMPGMLGTDLIRDIALVLPHAAFVLMTGGVIDLADLPKGVPLLRKPFSVPDLVAVIEQAEARATPHHRPDTLRAQARQHGWQ